MGRPSQSQPPHRRPSWAKTERAYQAYIGNNNTRPRHTGADYGLDNFAYDPAHVSKWQMPPGLAKYLPEQLRDVANSWVFAGAAVETALERIEAMSKEAETRTNPASTHGHLLGNTKPNQASAVVGDETLTSTPPESIPDSPMAPEPVDVVPFEKPILINPLTQRPTPAMGLESPPYTPRGSTPRDSKVSRKPTYGPVIGPNGMEADPKLITAQLSSLSSPESLIDIDDSGNFVKNTSAWEFYIGSFNAEIDDVQKDCITRLKGYTRRIKIYVFELQYELPQYNKDTQAALREFQMWWTTKEAKVSEIEKQVGELEKLEVMTPELRAARARAQSICSLPQ